MALRMRFIWVSVLFLFVVVVVVVRNMPSLSSPSLSPKSTADGSLVHPCPPFGYGTREAYIAAANRAGLDASLLSYCNGAWYYNSEYMCVSGTENHGECPATGVICAPELVPEHHNNGDGDATEPRRSDGSLDSKMRAIAYVLANGPGASGCTVTQ